MQATLPGFEEAKRSDEKQPPRPVEVRLPTLRPYQSDCVSAVLAQLKDRRSTLAVLFTGAGKSVIFTYLALRAKKPVLILVDGDILVDNAVAKLEEYSDSVEVEQGDQRAYQAKIVVASLDSVIKEDRLRRMAEYGFGLVIIDEAHRALADGYGKVVAAMPDAKICGFTATPKRGDRRSLAEMFETVAYQYDLYQAIKDGWASPMIFRNAKVKTVDFSAVDVRMGDLDKTAAAAIMGSEESLHGIVGSTIESVGARPTIMFANSIQNARRMTELFNRYKGKDDAFCVDSGDMRTRNEKRAILAGFKRGDYQFFINVNVATEGFDAPQTAAIGLAAPTLSEVRFIQQVGRGARGGPRCPLPGKTDCLVLDYVGNTGRHSIITPAYTLAGRFGVEVQKIAARISREKPETDAMEIVRMSREEWEQAQVDEAKRRKFIIAKVDFSTTEVDPFAIIKAKPPNPMRVDTSGPVTPKQMERLSKWRMDIPKYCTSKMATQLIRKEHDRLTKGLASYRMCRWGMKYGYVLRNVTRGQAKVLFEAVKANNFEPIARHEAARILLTREAGED